MTVSNKNPVADSLILPGDEFSFDLNDGGTTPSSIQVTVKQLSDDIAWTLAGGFQPGFSGTAVKVGNVYTVTVSASSGWDKSPFTVQVDWTISGTPSTSSWSYALAAESLYPDLMQPRNPEAQGTLIVTDNGVSVRTDVGWQDFVGFTVANLGNGKVRIVNASGLQANVAATAAPGVTDDSDAGYGIGSLWVDVTNDETYTATDVTVGAAGWVHTSSAITDHGALTGLADDDHTQYGQAIDGAGAPGVATGDGYRLGTVYSDTTNDVAYTLVDATAGANVWDSGGGGSGDVVGPASSTADGIVTYDGTTGKLIKNHGVGALGAAGTFRLTSSAATFRMKEKGSAAAFAAANGDFWVKNDAPCRPMFTDDAGTDHSLGEISTFTLATRIANAGTSTYVHGSGAAPWDYSGMNATLTGAQGSPGDPTSPAGGIIVPFDGVITSVSGVVKDSTTNASTTGDIELWKWNGTSDTAISTWTGTQVGTSLYSIYTGRTTAGNWMKFSQTPALSVSAGDYIEPLAYIGTVSTTGLVWFNITITIERTA